MTTRAAAATEERNQSTSKLVSFLVIVFCAYVVISTTLSLGYTDDRRSLITSLAPRVDFETFVEKYLRTGQVKFIRFVDDRQIAVVRLHKIKQEIIDGRPVNTPYVVVNYPYSYQQLRAEVRKVEAEIREMGINPGREEINIWKLNSAGAYRLLFAFFFIPTVFAASCIVCTNFGRRTIAKWFVRTLPESSTRRR